MSYLEHRPDTCKTAQDVLIAARKVITWRRAHEITLTPTIQPIEPITAPEPISEPPEVITRDWLYVDPSYDRIEKWPAGFITKIKSLVAKEFLVPVLDLDAARRDAIIIVPRHVAIYLCKTLTLKSLPEIGRRFGHRDHTTILHAVRKIQKMMLADQALCGRIAELQARLGHDLAKWRAYG